MCKMNVNLIHLFFVKNTYRKGLFIMSKKLVAFFSASGTTKKVAEMIAEEAKADSVKSWRQKCLSKSTADVHYN